MLTFADFILLDEHVLSIGLNPEHEKYREHHRNDIHNLLRKSYEKLGGYCGHGAGTENESKAIHSDISNPGHMIKAVRRNGKISAVSLYKKKHGRKLIGGATDGSDQGKHDFRKTMADDHKEKRSWAEVSGAPEHIQRKMGVPVVHNSNAKRLTSKDDIHPDENGEHYERRIGDRVHKKVIMGHPKD